MKWQIIRSPSGYRARFIANNGEPIMWSETYDSQQSAYYAIRLISESVGSPELTFEEVDER